MTISFEIPREIERVLRTNEADLNHEAKEVFLVDLYRQHRISHFQLSESLNLSRFETDHVLKRHGVGLGLSPEELRSQSSSLHETLLKDGLG